MFLYSFSVGEIIIYNTKACSVLELARIFT